MNALTIRKEAIVKNGKIEIDVPELKDGTVGTLTGYFEQLPEKKNTLDDLLDLARQIADSGAMDDLPSDYAKNHKKQKVVE
jgi:hypothetical protein